MNEVKFLPPPREVCVAVMWCWFESSLVPCSQAASSVQCSGPLCVSQKLCSTFYRDSPEFPRDFSNPRPDFVCSRLCSPVKCVVPIVPVLDPLRPPLESCFSSRCSTAYIWSPAPIPVQLSAIASGKAARKASSAATKASLLFPRASIRRPNCSTCPATICKPCPRRRLFEQRC